MVCSLVVRQRILLYLLSDASRVNRLVAGVSVIILLIIGRWILMMFWMVLITLSKAFLSWAVHKPCQIVMFLIVDKNLALDFGQQCRSLETDTRVYRTLNIAMWLQDRSWSKIVYKMFGSNEKQKSPSQFPRSPSWCLYISWVVWSNTRKYWRKAEFWKLEPADVMHFLPHLCIRLPSSDFLSSTLINWPWLMTDRLVD